MVNKIVLVILISGLFVALNFYLFEGVSSQLLSKYEQTNRKEPRNVLEEWQPIKKELGELMEEKQELVRKRIEEIAQKEAFLQDAQQREEPFEKEQQKRIQELEETIRKQGVLLSEILEKSEKQLSLLDKFSSQPANSQPAEVWDAKSLRVENVVLGDADRAETPLNVVLKTLTHPPFELVLERPLHGFAESMINSTRGFIPMAAMIFQYVLAERCKAQGLNKPLVVDVGANIGYLTGYGQALGCNMYSFEPYPSAFRVMRSMVKRNPNSANVFTFPQVVSSGHGFLSLQENDKWVFNRVKANGNLRIATIALDDAVQKEVVLLKIDVEGHEMQVLKGATKLIEEKVENILIEFKKEGDVEDRLEWLNSMIANPKWKVYAFFEGYKPADIEKLYKEFDITKHATRFVRLTEPVNEKDWIQTEDLWFTTQESPFDF